MFSKLSTISKSLTKPLQEIVKLKSYRHIYQTPSSSPNFTPSTGDVEVIDVNLNDNEISDFSALPLTSEHIDVNTNSVVSAVDIDPWVDEAISKQGTVDIEMIENYQKDLECIEPPTSNRSGSYEFQGIKISLPKKILSPATYRYRHDAGGEEVLPDDTRICKFDK